MILKDSSIPCSPDAPDKVRSKLLLPSRFKDSIKNNHHLHGSIAWFSSGSPTRSHASTTLSHPHRQWCTDSSIASQIRQVGFMFWNLELRFSLIGIPSCKVFHKIFLTLGVFFRFQNWNTTSYPEATEYSPDFSFYQVILSSPCCIGVSSIAPEVPRVESKQGQERIPLLWSVMCSVMPK